MPRRPLALAGALLLLAAAPAAAQQAAPDDGPPAAPEAGEATPPVLVVGDSLHVGARPFLRADLAPAAPVFSVRSGITTPQTMDRLRALLARVPAPAAVVVSSGTNDGPSPARFADRVRRTLALVPAGTCVVWPAVHRAPRKGAFRALNDVLRAAAAGDERLVVPGWDRLVDRGRVRLPDGVHPDRAGYARRSQLVAQALRRCT
jgi:hypothetical protein